MYCKFQNTYFAEHLWVAASVYIECLNKDNHKLNNYLSQALLSYKMLLLKRPT